MNKWIAVLLCFLQSLSSYEISIVSMFRNEGPYLDEWVRYHHLIGVDHFYLYNNNSTDNFLEILQPYIEQGVVEIIDWPTIGDQELISTQMRAFGDGLKRTIGETEWVGFIDIDEFVVPIKNATIKECFSSHFKHYDGVYINWRNFGTSHVTIPQSLPILTKLTGCSLPNHSDNAIGKSFVKPEMVDLPRVWYPHHFVLKEGGKYANGDARPCSFIDVDLKTDGIHHNKLIVLNHYSLRDEWFFHNRRIPSIKHRHGNMDVLMEHYESFNLVSNPTIVNFLKKYHPQAYTNYWETQN